MQRQPSMRKQREEDMELQALSEASVALLQSNQWQSDCLQHTLVLPSCPGVATRHHWFACVRWSFVDRSVVGFVGNISS
jgi:hypothetical protein